MHHLGVGYAPRGTRILAIADDTTVTVINLTTAEILSHHDIDPPRATGATHKEPRADGPGFSR